MILKYSIDDCCVNLGFAPLRVILSVRDSCIDWKDGVEPESDPAIKGKKDPDTGFPISVPRKCVAPSATQVQRNQQKKNVVKYHMMGTFLYFRGSRDL